MRKKLVLIKPPETTHFNFGAFSLAVLAAGVRREAEVVIIDATALSCQEAAQQTLAETPDLVGVTVMSQESVAPAAALIGVLRKALNSPSATVPIIAGGHGASMNPEPILDAGADAVVFGEGELTLLEIVRHGITPSMAGTVVPGPEGPVKGKPRELIEPLDLLQAPARELMKHHGDPFMVETSRGCPHACRFCETTRFYGRRWRPRSPAAVAAEVRELVERHSAWIIHFADDNFSANPGRVLQICEELLKGELPAVIFASVRADDLHKRRDILEAMAAASIKRVNVGVETLDPASARKAGKGVAAEVYGEVFADMRECDIFSVASFIVGLPGESPEARKRHLELALDVAPDSAQFVPFQPLPGTPYAKPDGNSNPDPADLRDSLALNEAYRSHPGAIARLRQAVANGGMRGVFAAGVLDKMHEKR